VRPAATEQQRGVVAPALQVPYRIVAHKCAQSGATPEPPGTVTFGGLAPSALKSHHGAWSRKARNVSGEGGELRLAPVSARAREQARAVPCLVTADSVLAGVACAGPDLQRGSRMVDQFVLSKHLSDCGMKTCAPVLLQLCRSTAVSLTVPPLASRHLPSSKGLLSLAVGLSSITLTPSSVIRVGRSTCRSTRIAKC
jgi:hypothetical protein